MECANTCTQNCVAFNTYATEEQEQEGEEEKEEEEEEDDDEEEGAKEGEQKEKEATSSKGDCYHYSNRSSLITANERQWAVSKAYIKCLGNNEWWHSFKLCDLPYYKYSMRSRLCNNI